MYVPIGMCVRVCVCMICPNRVHMGVMDRERERYMTRIIEDIIGDNDFIVALTKNDKIIR